MKIKDEAIGGLSAGIVGTVIGFPLDLIKTRMQTTQIAKNKGILSIGASIARKEGVLALYKGVVPPLISLSILNTLNFSSYSIFREYYNASHGWDIRNALAGMTVGPFGSLISSMEGMIKTQMQLDNVSRKRFRNSFHCFTALVKENGFLVLYNGHVVNTVRECVFLGTYFYTYEGVRELLVHKYDLDARIGVPFSGGLAGALAWFVSFPLDCIRAGVQGQVMGPSVKKGYYTALDLWKTKGIMGLYAGVSPSIARAFLVSGSRFSAYEFALWMLRESHDAKEI
mmetsp:Transcript_12716/g.19173  ORF Transcript_12716/g.19173 Transcript_12716/m.19173 type:complete len:284 (+) Transcript_12716:129-980(+)